MRLVSSFMDDLILKKGECHTITFQSGAIQTNFRRLLNEYFTNKKSEECNYIKLLNSNGNKIEGKNIYYIPFDCNAIYLKEDRSTNKQVKEILAHYLENNPNLLSDFLAFNKELNLFLSRIEFVKDKVTINFQPTEKTIAQIIKSLNISIEYQSNEYVPNYAMRDFLINALIGMNVLNKNVILLISYPESDIGLNDFEKAMMLLKNNNITTLVISSHRDILAAVSDENMYLINENGSVYDIIMLKNELLELKIVEPQSASEVSKALAYRDFLGDYFLLENDLKEFLLSNKI